MSATPAVKITLADGIERALFYPYSALKRIRDEFGISFNKREGFDKADEELLPVLVQIGLECAAKLQSLTPPTVGEVADLMDGEQSDEYFALVLRAATGRDIMDAVKKSKSGTVQPKPEPQSNVTPISTDVQ